MLDEREVVQIVDHRHQDLLHEAKRAQLRNHINYKHSNKKRLFLLAILPGIKWTIWR